MSDDPDYKPPKITLVSTPRRFLDAAERLERERKPMSDEPDYSRMGKSIIGECTVWVVLVLIGLAVAKFVLWTGGS